MYAMTKVAVQLSGVISMATDFGVSLTGVVKSDSSSAISALLTEMVWEVGAYTSRCSICGFSQRSRMEISSWDDQRG